MTRLNKDFALALKFISGISSGLGKSLIESSDFARPLVRHSEDLSMLNDNLVIYCGINKDAGSIEFVLDNFEFLHRIILSKPAHLILISSIDVYQPAKTRYAELKLALEHFVKSCDVNSTILRLPMLLTNYSRRNHLVKMFDHEKITLSGGSSFNYINQYTIEKVLETIADNKIFGTFDITSKNTITLNQIKSFFNLNCKFGKHTYRTPEAFGRLHPKLSKLRVRSEKEIQEFFKL